MREYARRCAAYYVREYHLDPALVRAVIQVESAWNPGAVSSAGAMGLMQLMPATGRRYGARHPFWIHETSGPASRTWPIWSSCFMAICDWRWPRTTPAKNRFWCANWAIPIKTCTATSVELPTNIEPSCGVEVNHDSCQTVRSHCVYCRIELWGANHRPRRVFRRTDAHGPPSACAAFRK